jgi:hypothetical protein
MTRGAPTQHNADLVQQGHGAGLDLILISSCHRSTADSSPCYFALSGLPKATSWLLHAWLRNAGCAKDSFSAVKRHSRRRPHRCPPPPPWVCCQQLHMLQQQ